MTGTDSTISRLARSAVFVSVLSNVGARAPVLLPAKTAGEGLGTRSKGGVDNKNCGIHSDSPSVSESLVNEGGQMMATDKAHRLVTALRKRLSAQDGQAMVEYALIMALVTIVAIAALQAMGISVTSFFGTVNSALTSVAT